MFFSASRTARSGTPEYPTPRVVVERMVSELITSQRWSWVTFETKPMKHFVEVAYDGGDELEINVAFGFSEDYQSLFARQGLTIPDGWRVTQSGVPSSPFQGVHLIHPIYRRMAVTIFKRKRLFLPAPASTHVPEKGLTQKTRNEAF